MAPSPLFCPRDEAALSNAGLLGPIDTSGNRRLHPHYDHFIRNARYPNPNSSILPILCSQEDLASFFTIPSDLHSPAMLVNLGYKPEQASHLWNRWCNPNDIDKGLSFIDFVTGPLVRWSRHINASPKDDDRDWLDCMKTWGLTDELGLHIIGPPAHPKRSTLDCVQLVIEVMTNRLRLLQDIHKGSRQREMILQNQQTPAATEHHGKQQ